MKKICRTIKLMKFKSEIGGAVFKGLENTEFIVCFRDNTYKYCTNKWDLRIILEHDHIKRVAYIFDITDRIVVDRNVLIDTDSLLKE